MILFDKTCLPFNRKLSRNLNALSDFYISMGITMVFYRELIEDNDEYLTW